MTTQLAAIRDLAALIHTIRPTWDATPTANQLLAHKDVPLHILTAAAIRCAQDETNRTPAALKWMTLAVAKPGEREVFDGTTTGPRCFTCGRTQAHCEQAHDVEVANGIPDPHRFETKTQAEQGKARNQWSEDDRRELAEARSRRAEARAALAPAPDDAA